MKIAKHNSGLIIGGLFTIVSIFLITTFVVPIISIIPGVLIEKLASNIINNDPYSNVGKLTIKFLIVIFALTLILNIISLTNSISKSGQVFQRQIFFIMIRLYFIIHPLGFYIYWGVCYNFNNDGQLIFIAGETCLFSSPTFILVGLLVDFIKNRALIEYSKQNQL